MKTIKNITGQLDCTRRLACFVGKRTDGTPYRFVGTRVRVYRDIDGNVKNPETEDVTQCTVEYHGVTFDPVIWDAVAKVAGPLDDVFVKGTLLIGDTVEEGHRYEGHRKDGTPFVSGDLVEAKPCGIKRCTVFAGATYNPTDALPVELSKTNPT